MRSFFSVLFLISLLEALAFAQTRRGELQPPRRIDQSKPSVYVSFQRSSSVDPKKSPDDPDRLWFRLNNNLVQPIRIEAQDAGDMGEVRLFFDIVDGDDRPVDSSTCHVCSTILLARGKSLLFSIPETDLVKGEAFRIQFSYPWEDDVAVFAGREAKHFVYYYLDKLPLGAIRRTGF